MNNVIIDSLNYFYMNRPKKDQLIHFNDEITDLFPTVIVDKKEPKKYNLIGVLDINTKQFTWAWHLNIANRQYIKTKQLIFYAINKEPITLNDAYVKRLLTTSVIESIDINTLTIIIALSIYLTKADSYFTTAKNDVSTILYYGLYNIDQK